MDFIDYRKALGLSFDDKAKMDLFIKRIGVFIESGESIPFDSESERTFAYTIGEKYLRANNTPFDINLGEDPVGLQRAWLYLSKRTALFVDFLACVVMLYNTYTGKKTDKKAILNGIKKALADCHIRFRMIEDKDGSFIFPEGAKELDDALVSEPLEWLSDYPAAHTAFVKALKEYAELNDNNASDIADKFRKALEAFFQEFFGGEKSLENYKSEYGNYLSNAGVPAEIKQNFETLFQSYTNFINGYAKHHDKTQSNVLEYIMYQTGNIIRLLITLKREEQNNAH